MLDINCLVQRGWSCALTKMGFILKNHIINPPPLHHIMDALLAFSLSQCRPSASLRYVHGALGVQDKFERNLGVQASS